MATVHQWEAAWGEAGFETRPEAPHKAGDVDAPASWIREEEEHGKAVLAALALWIPLPPNGRPILPALPGSLGTEPEPASVCEKAATWTLAAEDRTSLPAGILSWGRLLASAAPETGFSPEAAPLIPEPEIAALAHPDPQPDTKPGRPPATALSQAGPERPWPAEPVADVFLRHAGRPAPWTGGRNGSAAGDPGVAVGDFDSAAAASRTAPVEGERSVRPHQPASLLSGPGPAGAATAVRREAAAFRLSAVPQVSLRAAPPEPLQQLPYREPSQPPAQRAAERAEASASGGQPAEPALAAGRNHTQPDASGVEPATASGPASPILHAAPERSAQPAAYRESPVESPQLQTGEPEMQQETPRLNGQLDLQVDGKSGERVRIRFAEAPGGVRMRVASSDVRLAESLRARWPTLEAGLRRAGWDPQSEAPAAAEAAGAVLDGGDSRPGAHSGEESSGGSRSAAQAPGHGHAQHKAGDGRPGDSRSGENDDARQEWLDLSALRRLGTRRQ